jgi:hypothetical protein
VVSTAWVVLGFIGMGRTSEVVGWWTGRTEWEAIRGDVVALAVASLIVLDLAINASISFIGWHRTDGSYRCSEGVDCGLCPYCPAGDCECLGWKNDRNRKCGRIPKVTISLPSHSHLIPWAAMPPNS